MPRVPSSVNEVLAADADRLNMWKSRIHHVLECGRLSSMGAATLAGVLHGMHLAAVGGHLDLVVFLPVWTVWYFMHHVLCQVVDATRVTEDAEYID